MAARTANVRAVIFCAATIVFILVGSANAQQFADPEFRTYPLKSTQPTAIEDSLRRFLSDRLDAGETIEIVSDNRGQRLLVRGRPEIQKLAHQFIQAIDLPSAQPTIAQSSPTTVLGYEAASVEELNQKLNSLRQRFAQQSHVRIAADERTRQLVVNAPQALHQELKANWNNPAYFQVAPTNPQQTGRPNVAGNVPQPQSPLALSRQQLQLQHIDWQRLLTSLRGVQGANAAVTSPQQGTLEVNLGTETGNRTQFLIDQNRQLVQISGTAEDTKQWTRVVQALDSQPANATEMQLTGRLGDAQPSTITRTITMLGAAGVSNQATRPLGQHRDAVGGNIQQGLGQQRPPLQLAQADAGNPGAQPGTVQRSGDGEIARQLMAGDSSGSFLGPVVIEFVEGTDIFIVRGQKRDVDRVMQIINDIERLTVGTEPTVFVYPLKHANSQAVATLVNELNANVFQARQGDVSVTALVKPNSILLIGREQGVESVKKIIAKLDVEAEASDQFKVFKLDYLPSVDAERTINNLYNLTQQQGTEETPNLQPRVRAVADFRSNSIVVQGSPRDLKEIADLLQQIDVKDSDTVSEVQVFKLKNTVAEEVADVLNETLATSESNQAQNNVGNQGAQGAGAGGQVNTQAQSSRAAMSLQMRVLDTEGNRLLDDETLSSGILSNVVVTFNERANAVVVTAPKGSMDLIAEIIRQLDELPAQEAELRVFNIVNGDANLLVEMLDTLFAQDDNQTGPVIQSAAGTGESTLVPLRFALDQRTNSIIASGNGADLRVVEAILLKLDSSDVSQRRSAVVDLQIQDATAVADAITQFVSLRRDALQSIAQDTTSQYALLEQEVVVVAEPNSNKLIVNATDRYFEDIMKIIKDLDQRQDMVMVKVLIAEVELNSTEEMGVELGIQDSLLFNRSSFTDGIPVPGFNFNNQPLGGNVGAPGSARDQVAGQALSDFSLGRQNGTLGYGGLVLSASNESVSVLVRALQEARRLDVISSPKVQMLNNTEGEVTVGQQVPYISGSNSTLGVIQNTVEFLDVGIILSILPRIGDDGLVSLDVLAEKSDLGDEESGVPISVTDGVAIRAPQINTSRARTIVTARDGQTVILGGLITKSRAAVERKVPYLADVPFFGRLFRTDGVAEQRTELLIILTPQIIRDDADLDRISADEYARMSWCLGNVIEVHGDIGPGTMFEEDVVYSDIEANPGVINQMGTTYENGAVQEGVQHGGQVVEPNQVPTSAPLPQPTMNAVPNAVPVDAFPKSTAPPLPNVSELPQAKRERSSVLLNAPRNASLFPRSKNQGMWNRGGNSDRKVAASTRTRIIAPKGGSSDSTVRPVNFEAEVRARKKSQLAKTKRKSSVFRMDEISGE